MKESIHKYFQIGTVQWMSYPPAGNDLIGSIRAIACDDFFDAIEICRIEDGTTRSAAKKLLQTSRLKVCYGAQPRLLAPGLNPNHTDEAERLKAEITLLEAIDEAEYLGAAGIAFLSGKWEKTTREQAYGQLLKTTRSLCDYAGRRGMTVELEVFDFDIAKAALIGPSPLAARFAADVRTTHNNFGLLLDLSHIPMTHETPEFAVRTLRPYLTHFHIGNTVCADPSAEGYGDEHQRFGFPGGSNDTRQLLDFLRILKNEGFFCAENPYVLSFEVKPWKDEDPDVIIANTKRTINRAWSLLED